MARRSSGRRAQDAALSLLSPRVVKSLDAVMTAAARVNQAQRELGEATEVYRQAVDEAKSCGLSEQQLRAALQEHMEEDLPRFPRRRRQQKGQASDDSDTEGKTASAERSNDETSNGSVT